MRKWKRKNCVTKISNVYSFKFVVVAVAHCEFNACKAHVIFTMTIETRAGQLQQTQRTNKNERGEEKKGKNLHFNKDIKMCAENI